MKDRATSNCVNPGPVETDMYSGTTQDFKEIMRPFIERTPGMNALGRNGRGATAEEVAKVIGLIAMPDSGWINGSVVSCNGMCGVKYPPPERNICLLMNFIVLFYF